jgi:hypothetical protein
MPTILRLLLAALLVVGAAQAQDAEAKEDHYFLQDPADVDDAGRLREPGDRIPVVFVHGFLKDDLELERKIHIVFSFLHGRFVKKVNRGQDPFELVFPLHYRYRPDDHYRELGRKFAARFKERFGEVPCILVVHSAGAMIGRWAADAGLLVLAMVGLAPAHGGSPGASLMYSNRKLLKEERVGEDHMDVVEQTLKEIGVPDPAARSLAWDNTDGAISKADAAKYGIEIQPKLPDFRYDRFDHFGILEHFVAPFAGFDFMGTAKKRKKSDRELEWEVLGQFSQKWKNSDGVVVPYPRSPADGETKVWLRTYKGIGHREIFFDKDVLETAWGQVEGTAAHLLADGPDPFAEASPPVMVADAGDTGGGPGEPEKPEDPETPEDPGEPGDPGEIEKPDEPDEPEDPTQLAAGGGDDLDLGDLDDVDLGDELGDELGGDLGEDSGDLDLDLGGDPGGDELVAVVRKPNAPVRPVRPPDGVDLRVVESSGLLPGPPARATRPPGAGLFGSWDPGRMTRWVDG